MKGRIVRIKLLAMAGVLCVLAAARPAHAAASKDQERQGVRKMPQNTPARLS